MIEYATAKAVITAIILGFAIGLQRSMVHVHKNETAYAGSRSFAIIALLGYIAGWLQARIPDLALVIGLLVGALLLVAYLNKSLVAHRFGLTTELSALATFLLGLLIFFGEEVNAVFLAVILIVLLESKPSLKRIEKKITQEDVNAAVLLLAMSFVVLPVLPDEMVGPYALFNPYKTWLMAVIVALLSFIGYAAMKLVGPQRGLFLTAAFGGLAASTALAITFSRMYRQTPRLLNSYVGGIALASSLMFWRILLLCLVVAPGLVSLLWAPLGGAGLAGLGFVLWYYRRSNRDTHDIDAKISGKNPLQISEALKFGLLFGVIFGLTKVVQMQFGSAGIYVVSLVSGLSDVDAITLSLSNLQAGALLPAEVAAIGILIASVTNSLVKLGIVFWMGGAAIGWRLLGFNLLVFAGIGAGCLLAW